MTSLIASFMFSWDWLVGARLVDDPARGGSAKGEAAKVDERKQERHSEREGK